MNRRDEYPVTFQPGGQQVSVAAGISLLEAAASASLSLDSPCGGEGTCGKCRLTVLQGAAAPSNAELGLLTQDELAAGCRLACQSAVEGPMTVLISEATLTARQHQILVESETAVDAGGATVIAKQYVELPCPDRGDDVPDLARLCRRLGPLEVDLGLVRELPQTLRSNGFRGTAVRDQNRLIAFEPGNTETCSFGVAIDLGTTTLAAALLDLAAARQVAVVSRLNPQTRFGDDVLSRILMARSKSDGLSQLQRCVAEALDAMIGELCEAAGIQRQQVYTASVAGNTTMQQLFCGINPAPLGEVPFVPALQAGFAVSAAEIGLRIHPRGNVYILPIIGSFVGGDIVGGILATGMAESPAPTLLIDIGTNGEIVLQSEGRLTATSTAAGPAFEGARIEQGMRASRGAIEKVVIDGQLRTEVIGHVPAVGICGSALIDATAELLRHGALAPEGRFLSPGELPGSLPSDVARRIELRDGQPAFLLSDAGPAGGQRILLTQRDVREVQLASGAIRAGIELLLRRHGLRPSDLDRVLLAGGFGNYIRRGNAQRMGLLPPEIEPRRIEYRGNTSLAGARLVCQSRQLRQRCDELAAGTEHVDLSLDPDFSTAFADAMIFPER